MHRNIPGRVLGGVCAALSLQLGIDAVLIRVVFVLSLALSVGLSFWAYALLWVLTPFEADGESPIVRSFDWAKGILGRADAAVAPSTGTSPPAT
jgi:phage shock protein PspC (stress-responsive transcriptional regulator)